MNQPLAYIHPDAKIDPSVNIGPFVSIDKNVIIGEGTKIAANVTILEGSRIGKNCNIFPGAVIGATPQDLKFKGEETLAIIGDNTTIRECVTINRGTASKATQLAGEVVVGDFTVIGGGTLVHQFTHIGAHAMIQGGSKVTKDVPPFVTAGREPLIYDGVNSIGLRRRGYTNEQIRDIQETYRYIFQMGMNTSHAIEKAEAELPNSNEKNEILTFVKNSPRGIIKGHLE